MISYQIEPWSIFANEASPLWVEQQAEVGDPDLPQEINGPLYTAFEAAGQLQILTAREHGHMIGYCVMLICQHSHYAALCGFEDSYFLTKTARKGPAGIHLIRKSLEAAKARGVRKVFFYSKVAKDLQSLFTRLGFVHSDELWSKVL